jgi:hypothetical protein
LRRKGSMGLNFPNRTRLTNYSVNGIDAIAFP